MPHAFDFTILYVRDVAASVAFYEPLIGAPVEASPGFAMFVFPSGARLGLWKAAGVAPAPTAAPGASEIAVMVARAGVDALHAEWSGRGVAIAQPPSDLDFGRTFLALDPDGHRLRVFAPCD